MANSAKLGDRIDEFVQQLEEEFGELPESDEPLMTRIEDWAIEIGDAVMTRVVKRKLESPSSTDSQECCPTCGRIGHRKGNRGRLLQTRRGKVRLEEIECYCSPCRKSFFPVSKLLGIEPDSQLTPGALAKVVHAGAHAGSFRQAEADLLALAELSVSSQRVRRATQRIGHERVAQRDEEVERFLNLPLPEQQRSPTDQVPSLACVEMDGGRIQIRDRKAKPAAAAAATDSSRKGRFWRESKVGCLLSMESETHAEDPCPTIPEVFVDPRRVNEMSREIKGFSAESEASDKAEESRDASRKRPEILVKTVVATREDIHVFGRQLAAAAWQRGFAGAARKAFVADGLAANWTVWRKHFSRYTPILDFVHAIMYVYAAAMADRSFATGWDIYCRWAQAVWSGGVEEVLVELHWRQKEVGLPEKDDPDHSPRRIVADALRYLTNQQTRMQYDAYRREGLPITSSHIESTIKQINRRVKGSEKFWNTSGAEALLQLSADYLSETAPLAPFWRSRQSIVTGHRHYQAAT